MACLAETAGGLCLALGVLTPIAAAFLLSVMLVASVAVHLEKGFFAQNGGYEFGLVLGLGALSLAFTGPGSLSLDTLFGYAMSGTFWGVGALVVGLLGGAIQLVLRRRAPQQTESGS